MKHSFIDQYSNLDSLVQRLDPRTKLITSLVFVLAITLAPQSNWRILAVYLCVISIWIWLSKLPLAYVLKRSLVIFPFVLMIAVFTPFFKQGTPALSYNLGFWRINVTYEGISIFLNVIIKSWLCMLCLIVLSSSTKFTDLLAGMHKLKIPYIFIQIISFMYRYLFVLQDQAMRMQMARDSRDFGRIKKNAIKTIGNIIGILFIRSYERGERIYAAMLSRGYNGEMPISRKLRFAQPDIYFSIALVVLLVSPALLWW